MYHIQSWSGILQAQRFSVTDSQKGLMKKKRDNEEDQWQCLHICPSYWCLLILLQSDALKSCLFRGTKEVSTVYQTYGHGSRRNPLETRVLGCFGEYFSIYQQLVGFFGTQHFGPTAFSNLCYSDEQTSKELERPIKKNQNAMFKLQPQHSHVFQKKTTTKYVTLHLQLTYP